MLHKALPANQASKGAWVAVQITSQTVVRYVSGIRDIAIAVSMTDDFGDLAHNFRKQDADEATRT